MAKVHERLVADNAGHVPATQPATLDAGLAREASHDESRKSLLAQFHPLFSGSGGIDSWLREATPPAVVERQDSSLRAP